MCGDVQEKTLYGLELKAGVFPNLMFPRKQLVPS